MAQDLREMFERNRNTATDKLKDGHRERFLKRLDEALPKRGKSSFFGLKMAASLLLCLGLAGYLYTTYTNKTKVIEKADVVGNMKEISLGDLSPDLQRVENYYVSSINLELSKLELTDKNKVLVDSFMQRLEELDHEYNILTKELNEVGPNDQTIAALIRNLQLRLELLHKLKVKLNELKSLENETAPVI